MKCGGKHRRACWQFEKRPHDAQLAEAVVFRVVQKCNAKPDLADQSGGPDFISAKGQFMVEATAFTIDKVTSDSFLPNEISEGVRVHAYAHLTRQISARAGKVNFKLSAFLRQGDDGEIVAYNPARGSCW